MSDDLTAGLQQQFGRHTYQAERARFSADDAIVNKTLKGVLASWNANAERVFGYTARGAVAHFVGIPVNPRDEETVIIERITKRERIEHFDTVRMRKGKAPLDISLTISPIRDSSGKIVGASKLARDITQPKQIVGVT